MNIKNERVHELARRAARLTGESQTSVLEAALTQYLAGMGGTAADDRLQASRMDLVRSLVADFNAGLTHDQRSGFRAAFDDLYDEAGLPR